MIVYLPHRYRGLVVLTSGPSQPVESWWESTYCKNADVFVLMAELLTRIPFGTIAFFKNNLGWARLHWKLERNHIQTNSFQLIYKYVRAFIHSLKIWMMPTFFEIGIKGVSPHPIRLSNATDLGYRMVNIHILSLLTNHKTHAHGPPVHWSELLTVEGI